MRISDWSSDVCSSDLTAVRLRLGALGFGTLRRLDRGEAARRRSGAAGSRRARRGGFALRFRSGGGRFGRGLDRKSVVEGKSVSVRVDLGGRRIIKTKTASNQDTSRYARTHQT